MNNFKVLEHSGLRQWFVPREDRDTPIKAEQLREIQRISQTQPKTFAILLYSLMERADTYRRKKDSDARRSS